MSEMWNRFIDWLKREPTILVQLAQGVLGGLVAFGAIAFSEAQTGAVLGLVSAASGLFLALGVRPFKWPTLVGLAQAAIVLASEFWFNFTDEQIATIYGIIALLSMSLRQMVTPEVKLQPQPAKRLEA